MHQYEQIVEDIMTILAADVDPTEAAIRDVDTRYADAVNSLNERLVECDKLLHKGFRTEAIQKCEMDPNLLDAMAVMDFPEAPQWGEYVRQFGLPEPPQLRLTIAADLNEAYSHEASLSDRLRQHRLLALARAPLGTRLKVLRQIAKCDPGNPVWQQDLRSWEQVRHDRLPKEVEAAAALEDAKTLAVLGQEVQSKDWLAPPPKALVERVLTAHKQVSVKRARRHLEVLEKELNEAYANFDITRARILRQRWKTHAAVGIEREEDPLLALVAPALEWLDEQERQEQSEKDYQAALAALGAGLDRGLPRQELERLQHAVLGFDRGGLPETLEHRLQERYASLEVASGRKSRLILVSVVLAALLAAGGFAWIGVSLTRSKERKTHTTSLQQLLQDKKLKEAASYLRDLEQKAPHVLQTPELQKLAKDVEAATRADQQRRSRFDQALADARRYGEAWEGYGNAVTALKDAEPLCVNDSERQELEEIRRQVEARRQQLQRELDEKFVADFTAFKKRADEVDPTDLTKIEQLRADGEVLAKRPFVASVLRNQVQPLLERLKKLYDTEVAGRTESGLLSRITEAVGDRNRYLQTMQTYVSGFPTKARANDFKRVLETEAELWDGVERWNRLLESWSQRDFRKATPAEAAQLITDAEELVQKHPGFPAEKKVQEVVAFLAAVKQRLGDDGQPITTQLTADLQMAFMVELCMLQTSDQKRYYFKSEKRPQRSGSKWTVTHFGDLQFQETQQIDIGDAQIVNRPADLKALDAWLSPQRKFSDFALEQLGTVTDFGWERTFSALIARLYGDSEIDPVLKVQLLSRVTQVACTGSQPLQESFGKYVQAIQTAQLNDAANWVNPEDSEGQRTRDASSNLIRRLEAPDVLVIRAGQLWTAMEKPALGDRYAWIGCLYKDTDNQFTCGLPPGLPARSGELRVVQQTSSGTPLFTKIGMLDNGSATLQLGTPGAAVEGRPVFVLVSKR